MPSQAILIIDNLTWQFKTEQVLYSTEFTEDTVTRYLNSRYNGLWIMYNHVSRFRRAMVFLQRHWLEALPGYFLCCEDRQTLKIPWKLVGKRLRNELNGKNIYVINKLPLASESCMRGLVMEPLQLYCAPPPYEALPAYEGPLLSQ